MSTYDELLAASKAAWDAYFNALDELRENGWTDVADQETKYAALVVLWEAYVDARAALGGAY